MAAETQDYPDAIAAPESAACTVTVYPLQTVFPRQVWTMDSYALPIPPLLQSAVRDEVTWRMVIHAAIAHYQAPAMDKAERLATADEYRAFRDTLMYLGPDSNALARLIVQIFPVMRCRFFGCRQPYLRYTRRLRHCSDACRRAQERMNQRGRIGL